MSNSDKKLVLLVGVLAAGIFSAAFATTQFLSANAQSTNGTDDEVPMPVDIGCPTGAEVCEDDVSNASHPTVSTSGTATAKVQPDKFSVTVGVETNGSTAKEAADKNADLTAKVVAAFRGLGIAEADISTSGFSVYPVYGSRPAAASRSPRQQLLADRREEMHGSWSCAWKQRRGSSGHAWLGAQQLAQHTASGWVLLRPMQLHACT